jgi:hypothetical protein
MGQNARDHGNVLVYSEKFNYCYDERQKNTSCTDTLPHICMHQVERGGVHPYPYSRKTRASSGFQQTGIMSYPDLNAATPSQVVSRVVRFSSSKPYPVYL